MGAVMTRQLVSCLATVRQIRAAYDTGAGASDPKTNKQVVYSVQLAGSVHFARYPLHVVSKLVAGCNISPEVLQRLLETILTWLR